MKTGGEIVTVGLLFDRRTTESAVVVRAFEERRPGRIR
jgi:hypothetical protein